MYGEVDNNTVYEIALERCLPYGSPFLPDIVTKTEGVYFWTASGNKVMDFTSGQMSTLLGHGHPEIVEVAKQHTAELDHLYSGMMSPPVAFLAKALTDVLPNGLDKAMFLSTGGESNDCAIKLAKIYTGKFEIVGLSKSWHGMTGSAVSTTYNAGRKGFGPLVPGMHMIPAPDSYRSIFRHADGTYDWKTELDYGWSLIDKASYGSLAAVILEPILSSGGMITLPSGYLKAMKEHCEARGMLLILDEAQTALGRCGDLFAFEHASNDGVVPDILTLSKTLGNGLPLSAVIASNAVARAASKNGFIFYTTHANDPLPAAVGLKVLSVVLRDNRALIARARAAGEKLHAGLQRLKSRYACIGAVNGRGLMAGIEIVHDRRQSNKADIELGKELSASMMNKGLSAMISARDTFSGCIRIAPPIVVTNEQMQWALDVMEEAFESCRGSEPLNHKM